MVYEYKFPDIGEGITEGEIVEWNVKEGDEVKEHDVIGKVETDKAIAEIPTPRSGVILKIHKKPGEVIKVGEVMVTIGEKGEKVEKKKEYGIVGELPAEEKEFKFEKKEVAAPTEQVLATPAIRKLAKELGVDISQAKGTGPGGRITEEDLKGAPKAEPTREPEIKVTKKYDMYGYVERIPLKGVRKIIAKHVSEAVHKAAHVTHMDEVDVTKLAEIRNKGKKAAAEKGIKLTYLPFIIKALIETFKEYPEFNSSMDDENEEIIIKKYYNIGIAVDTENGLIVPVVKGADQKDILQIAKEIEELANKVKGREIDLADLKGGTFTITNYGSIGGIFGTPIINYPEVAILGIGRMYDKAVVREGKIVVRKVLPLVLSFDHRVVDGADAAKFMNTLKKHLEMIEK